MTTKSELLAKIKELQAQADAMPDDKLNPVFVPKKGDRCWDINGCSSIAGNDLFWAYFRTKEAAEAYGEAYQTITDLHALSDWNEGETVWHPIDILGNPPADNWVYMTTCGIFGRFVSKESAQAAIDKIGKERIEKAFDVLARGNV